MPYWVPLVIGQIWMATAVICSVVCVATDSGFALVMALGALVIGFASLVVALHRQAVEF